VMLTESGRFFLLKRSKLTYWSTRVEQNLAFRFWEFSKDQFLFQEFLRKVVHICVSIYSKYVFQI
jgi:hypothetical protein